MFEKMRDEELEEYIIKLDKENKLSKYDEKTQIMVKLYRNSIDAQHSQFYAIKNAKLVLLLGTPKEKIKNFWAAYSSLNDAIPGIDWIKKYKKQSTDNKFTPKLSNNDMGFHAGDKFGYGLQDDNQIMYMWAYILNVKWYDLLGYDEEELNSLKMYWGEIPMPENTYIDFG